ncbi:integrase core domain-containing protein [Streptomyces sp. NPDC021098]|uniref:integrase core domain-containing protein n=1 Tax=unclassified Streptomyces TaxID=2593676 RepID=UPI003790E8FC
MTTAPRAPRMNAHCESVIGTLRREALDHVLVWNEARARHVLESYARHYNRRRPHQARAQRPPLAEHQTAPLSDLNTTRRLCRTRVLGGLISEYR